MSNFKVGDKVVLIESNAVGKVGEICEVVSIVGLPESIGVRYPHQQDHAHYPYHDPRWFVHIDVYNSPLYLALKEE